LTDSRKSSKLNFKKIRPVGAELSHENRWTDKKGDWDMTKLIVAFHDVANAPKNEWANISTPTTYIHDL
jgi:hypothetical protein